MGDLTGGWSFEPYDSGAPATCALAVYIANSIDAAGLADYQVLGKDVNATPIEKVILVDQAAHRGAWVAATPSPTGW